MLSPHPTWSPDIDVHAVVLDLALRGGGSDGGDAQVSGVQVLLGPLAVVRLVVHLQDRLLVKLLEQGQRGVREFKSNHSVIQFRLMTL